jgi:hypothetical protein
MTPAAPDPAPDGDPPVADISPALLRALAAHPEEMADVVEALHRRVVDEDTLLDLMGRASREAVRLLEDANWAGVTAQFAGVPFTAAHTDHRVLVVDEGQYGQGDGPCLTAMRENRDVTMTADQVRDLWPHLAVIAETAGVRAFLAKPLHARQRAVGSLNLYSSREQGLRTPDPDVVTVLTEYLDRGLTDYSAAQPGEDAALRIRRRLLQRHTIDSAIGVLMARHHLSVPDATDLLRLQAANLGLPDHEAAARILATTGISRDPDDTPK